MVSVPGFVRSQRFASADVQLAPPGPTKYLVRFDIATDDWSKTLVGFFAIAPTMKISPAFNGLKTQGFTYRAIGRVLNHAQAISRRR